MYKKIVRYGSLWVVFITLCILLGSFRYAQIKDREINIHKDIVYSQTEEILKMDLFIPKASEFPIPCVIVIQGGGFRSQERGRFNQYAIYLAENGIAAATIDYRGLPHHEYHSTITDVKTAVRFIKKTSKKYNIDPERIGAMGRSAGATLAVMLAVSNEREKIHDMNDYQYFSSKIKAAVAYAGVYDFITRYSDERQIALQSDLEIRKKNNEKWIGASFSHDNEHWLNASAISHVDINDAPVFFLHCKNDRIVPWLQSQNMYEIMKQSGIDSKIKNFKRGGHGFRFKEPQKTMAKTVKFFKDKL